MDDEILIWVLLIGKFCVVILEIVVDNKLLDY